jgi:hypothetical protein
VENSQCLWWFRWRKWSPGSSPDSSTLHKHISVAQLLELADPPLKLQDVAKTGALDPDPAMGHGWSWLQFTCPFFWLDKTMEKNMNKYKYSHDLTYFGASLFPLFWTNKCSIPNLGS